MLDKKYKHDIAVVVDRLVMKPDLRKRLADSIETAVALADGMVEIELVDEPDHGSSRRKILTFSSSSPARSTGPAWSSSSRGSSRFNSPHGACPRCTGPRLADGDRPRARRARTRRCRSARARSRPGRRARPPTTTSSPRRSPSATTSTSTRRGRTCPPDSQEFFLYGTNGERIQISYRNRFGRRRSYATQFEGIVPSLERRYRETESEYSREKIEEYMTLRPCPECKGARLRPESRAVLVGGTPIHEFTALPARRALEWIREQEFSEHDRRIARLVLREIEERLQFLENVGVGYLSMDRAAATLSGGEAQRIRLATQIGSSLVGVLYILDEPSIGLHQRDNDKLIATLERLRDLGNTVLVVEHDEGTMRAADHIVDMGPAAGEHGGHVVAEGTAEEVGAVAESLTGQFLAGTRRIEVPAKRRKPSGYVGIEGAAENNLQKIDVKFPLGVLCSVTGVSGSGKSTLVNEVLLKAVANHLHRSRQRAGHAQADHRPGPAGQDHLRRPVADRAHAAVQPGDVHRPVRPDPGPVLQDPGGPGARLQAGPVLVQRQGRPLRGVPR